jgi:hypothetical protein
MPESLLSVRAATRGDTDALRRLAWLDNRTRLTGGALVAERRGVAIAAVALTSGAVVADPSHPTATAIRALRLRRYQLLRQGGDVGSLTSVLRRLAPAA